MPIMNPYNPKYGTKGCSATTDKVFALSTDEAEMYFRDDVDRRAAVTPYARRQGSYCDNDYKLSDGQPIGWWWLRSPGIYSYSASFVSADGGVSRVGGFVNSFNVSVRPALWLNL